MLILILLDASFTLLFSGDTFQVAFVRRTMTCGLCSSLVADCTKPRPHVPLYQPYFCEGTACEIDVPFFVEEVYPGLGRLTRNAKDGCEFCGLLVQLLEEHFDAMKVGLRSHCDFSFAMRGSTRQITT